MTTLISDAIAAPTYPSSLTVRMRFGPCRKITGLGQIPPPSALGVLL